MNTILIADEQLHIYSRGHDHDVQYCDQLPENAEEIVTQIFSGELVYSEAFSDFVGRSSMTAGAPIYQEGTVIGAVLVHSPVSGIDDVVKQGMMALMIGCGAAMAAAGAVSRGVLQRRNWSVCRNHGYACTSSGGGAKGTGKF